MKKEELERIIIEQILEVAPDIEESEIILNQNIQQTLEIDSFDFLSILTGMNDKVGVEVPESDYSKVDTVENMLEYFLKRI